MIFMFVVYEQVRVQKRNHRIIRNYYNENGAHRTLIRIKIP